MATIIKASGLCEETKDPRISISDIIEVVGGEWFEVFPLTRDRKMYVNERWRFSSEEENSTATTLLRQVVGIERDEEMTGDVVVCNKGEGPI